MRQNGTITANTGMTLSALAANPAGSALTLTFADVVSYSEMINHAVDKNYKLDSEVR